MKIKSLPEDFIVEEFLTLPEFSPEGDYVVYRLEKRGLSTLEVVRRLIQRHGVLDGKINFAGMKDKYALTSQYLSISGKRLEAVKEKNFTLTPLGRTDRPVGPDLLEKNGFKITLRSLEKNRIHDMTDTLREISRYGFPNYFGEQRFGSIRHGKGFLAKRLALGDFEGALKLYLSGWSSEDRSAVKKFRKFVSDHWGSWEACLKVAPRSDERGVLAYLKTRPNDFLKAINLTNPRMLSLYIAAYQSYLWNEMAGEFVKMSLPEDRWIKFPYAAGEMVFYKTLFRDPLGEFMQTEIPLVDHKAEFPDGKIKGIAEKVMKREGMTPQNFRLNKIKRAFFKSVSRKLVIFPEGLEISDPAPDEIYPHKLRLTVSFSLPSGSYATVLLRRIGANHK